MQVRDIKTGARIPTFISFFFYDLQKLNKISYNIYAQKNWFSSFSQVELRDNSNKK